MVVATTKGESGGRYVSSSGPAAAARKAANRRLGHGVGKLTLTIRETGTSKEFTYKAERTKLATPYVRTINGKTVKSEYTTTVKKA